MENKKIIPSVASQMIENIWKLTIQVKRNAHTWTFPQRIQGPVYIQPK